MRRNVVALCGKGEHKYVLEMGVLCSIVYPWKEMMILENDVKFIIP